MTKLVLSHCNCQIHRNIISLNALTMFHSIILLVILTFEFGSLTPQFKTVISTFYAVVGGPLMSIK
jgi:hypothetical protein